VRAPCGALTVRRAPRLLLGAMHTQTLLRFLALVAFALSSALHAQTTATGTVTGRVTDAATKLALAGARVAVGGTGAETFTNAAGDFTLPNVPAGARTLAVSYVGYPEIAQAVDVRAGATATADIVFGRDAVRMDAFVISGSLVGQARAINQQRAAETLSNLVAADEIGRFPDQNAAESMQRIPGVALYRDQGEGRFIVVRGIRPDLNTVQLNGVSVATPDRGNRTLPLDVIPSDALGAVEIAKVATPDKEMDGLGGRVDLKTRSAFDLNQRDLQFSAQGQYNDLRDRLSSKFNGTYSDVFNGGTLAVIFAPTWQDRRMGSDNFEVGGAWTLRAVPGAPGQTAFFNNDINYRAYDLTRTRYGANGAVEFKPDRQSLYFVRGLYSRFQDSEIRQITTIPFSEGTLTALTPNSATVTEVRREAKQLRVRAKEQEVFNVSAGGELTRGNWQFDGRAAYSEGQEDRPEASTIFRKSTRGTSWSYSFASGLYDPVVRQLGGTSISDPASFNEFNRLRNSPATGSETEINIGGNARHTFTLADAKPAFVKFGAQFRAKEKKQEVEQINYAALPSYTFASLAEPQSASDYGFLTGPRLSAATFTRVFIDNKGAFTGTRDVITSLQSDWKTNEDVSALYAMGGVTLDRIKLAAGARYERTEFETKGNSIRTVGTAITATPASRGRDYDHFLPGVYFTGNLSRQTVVRAAWSNTLSRPQYAQSSLSRSVNDDTRLVTASNPDLKPLTAMNWDASIEHYFASLGTVSAAVFRKEIKNFTYQRTLPGADAATGYDLSTFVNGDQGRITGLELAYQQQFTFLPAPFDGLGVFANYTIASSSGTFPSRPGEKLPFIGQSRRIGNLALTWEKNGLFVRAALNFRTPRLREDEPLGATAAEDRYVDDFAQLDFTASYKLGRNWELFGEVLNANNAPFRVYFAKDVSRFVQFEEYGVSANFGVRWRL
jgi:TonB-dependent receptor